VDADTSHRNEGERPHIWTLPLAPCRWAYLQLPSRNITEAEWAQLLALLGAYRPGLIALANDDKETNPVEESIALVRNG
jgi:hypothetical protein